MLASAPPIWIQAQWSQVISLPLSVTVTFPKDWSKVTSMMKRGEDNIAPEVLASPRGNASVIYLGPGKHDTCFCCGNLV